MKTLRQRPHPSRLGFTGRPLLWRKNQSFEDREVFDECGEVEAIRYRVPTSKNSLTGHPVAYLADLHYNGTAAARRRLAGILTLLRRHPVELLLLGGDQCGPVSALPELDEALRLLAGTVPAAVAIPGNWERGKCWIPVAQWEARYRACGVTYLNNSYWENELFTVYGSDDFRDGSPQPPHFPHNAKGHILLVHEPDAVPSFDTDQQLRNTDLILAGHTHGGQVRVPHYGALTTSSHGGRLLDAGEFRHKLCDMPLYVTSGAGHLSFPFRFRCPPQVVWIEFVPGKRKSMIGRVAAP